MGKHIYIYSALTYGWIQQGTRERESPFSTTTNIVFLYYFQLTQSCIALFYHLSIPTGAQLSLPHLKAGSQCKTRVVV